MEPWLDDLPDDLQSMSFNSTTTDTEINTSISSGSETASSSAISFFSRTRAISCDDPRWSAIKQIRSDSISGQLSLSDLRFLQRLGSGDIGAVYLAEVKSSSSSSDAPLFAAKVMDKKELTSRNKEGRARTEREILEMLEHPFLPTLYAALETPNWSCLLTEFCPGGDLHVLRQRQPCRRFHEFAARFYASEVVVALEYVHMMGIIYRDLKPENVLVRSDGHIMLTDFDLSLKCDDSSTSTPQIISNPTPTHTKYPPEPSSAHFTSTSCILPNCIVPAVSCFNPNRRRRRNKNKNNPQQRFRPEFVTEPLYVRSMSFVGTHEYLAPEIVSGEGHGAGVDWWTLGIFIFELLYGTTPFRGPDNEMTLANIVARALEFPKETTVPAAAKDLVTQLLVKDPAKRLGSIMGASEIKQHPFFQGVNWALLRCTTPPIVPVAFRRSDVRSEEESCPPSPVEYY